LPEYAAAADVSYTDIANEGSRVMSVRVSPRLRAALAAALALSALAGCASSGPPSQAVQWIVETEAQKQRLNDAGFPQYVGSM
jgi:predicted small lipoprotein YifL